MLNKRWSVCAAAALLYGGTVAAQQPGTLLVGGFGQYTIFDSGDDVLGNLKNVWGGGGRLGVFLNRNWSLDVEGSYQQASHDGTNTSPDVKYSPIAARLTYGLPVYNRVQLLIGAGAVLSSFHDDVAPSPTPVPATTPNGLYRYGYGVTGGLGLRIPFYEQLALRGDAMIDYNFTDPTFTNYRFQAGLEWMPDLASWLGEGTDAPAHFDWFGPQPQPEPGTVELKGAAQYTYFGSDLHMKRDASAIGYGGGLGVFLTHNWELESDGYWTPVKRDFTPEEKYDQASFSLRANYNIPFGSRHQLIIGAGAVRASFHPDSARAAGVPVDLNTYTFGPEGLVGVRFGLANRFAVRVDGFGNYLMGDIKTFNFGARAGLSYFIGGASRAKVDTTPAPPPPPPPPAPDTTPAPPPAPAPPPPPPPAPVVDTTKITAPIYFDFDKSTIRSDAEATLREKLPYLTANPGMRIRIEGNTDERGSDEYNQALGQRRAAAAKKFLTDNGIDASRIDITSNGEEKPVCTDHNEDCWSKNRRDEFRIVVIGSDSIKAPQ